MLSLIFGKKAIFFPNEAIHETDCSHRLPCVLFLAQKILLVVKIVVYVFFSIAVTFSKRALAIYTFSPGILTDENNLYQS
jgi:hypothetical protein